MAQYALIDSSAFALLENTESMTVEEEESFFRSMKETKKSTFIVGFVNDQLVSIADIHSGKRERLKHQGELGISVR